MTDYQYIEPVSEVPRKQRRGWGVKVLREFLESGLKVARVKVEEGGVYSKAVLLRYAVKKMGVAVDVLVRDGKIYLVRNDAEEDLWDEQSGMW